jgi:hypothetical protein
MSCDTEIQLELSTIQTRLSFFFFFPTRFLPQTRSEVTLFGPSTSSLSNQGPVFRQVYKIKLDLDIEDVASFVCSLFNDAFSVSQTIQRRFLLNPDSSAI